MRRLARPLLALFLLWHVTAVTAYALPSLGFLPGGVSAGLSAITRPYALVTGQWQRWNAFAPDPESTVPFYLIETRSGAGAWSVVGAIKPTDLSPRIRPSVIHFAKDALQNGAPRTDPVAVRFLQERCAALGLAPGSRVRLRVRTLQMPIAVELSDQTGTGSLETKDVRETETLCPAGSAALTDPFPAVPL
jgi:hypothetical protein